MSNKKIAEKRMRELANSLGYYLHKYGDVRYCIHCKKSLPKTERAPDFYLALRGTWIEAKNNNAGLRWNWAEDIGPKGARANQREWIQNESGWLFIVFKEGRAPDGEDAYLVPWQKWAKEIEPWLIEEKQQSLIRTAGPRTRIAPADWLLAEYALVWDGGWAVPEDHIFWVLAFQATLKDLENIKAHLSKRKVTDIYEQRKRVSKTTETVSN